MNMNDKEWNEIWDDEADDDDDFNDIGSDIDANNDETFDNAAEWNEDEHEELIARDSILSHTRANRSSNNRSNTNNSRLTGTNNNNTNNNHLNSNNNNLNNNNNLDDSQLSGYLLNVTSSPNRDTWGTHNDKDSFPNLQRQDRQQEQSTSSNLRWQSASDRLYMLQLQQQQLLAQQRQLEEQQQKTHQRQQQQLRDRQILQHQQDRQQQAQSQNQFNIQADFGRQILRVDELERQLIKTRISQNTPPEPTGLLDAPKRTGWSPFGGKDLFTNPDSSSPSQISPGGPKIMMNSNLPHSLTIEQQQQLLAQQRHILPQHQVQQMAILKQHQIQQEQRLMSQNPQCFTVEELERQMMANRTANQLPTETKHDFSKPQPQNENLKPVKSDFDQEKRNNTHERREGERIERVDRYHRESRDMRDHRDRRDLRDRREPRDHRDNRMLAEKQKFKIIPPQVQLSVIDKAKLAHSLTTMHQDEFLQDRMPSSKEGFLFKRHSEALNDRTKHDGVLTEKERNWLTKIQEKIQADYDDNLDQDYYYLLYFNRFSMTDEAAQRPCGPGVMDRRFIPRERLLYSNTSS